MTGKMGVTSTGKPDKKEKEEEQRDDR